MKMNCVLAVLCAASIAQLVSASSISFRHGSKLGTQIVRPSSEESPVSSEPEFHPHLPATQHVEKEAAPEEKDSGIGIKITNSGVVWPDESKFPKIMQYFCACGWILMIAVLPFVLPVIDKREVTQTQKIVGVMVLVVLFGGLYLFTNIILFQSIHFKENRPLTMIECIYFMSQVITTVGYGDITPAKVRGQVFVALYVLGALFVIAMLVSQVVDHCKDLIAAQRKKMWGATPIFEEATAAGLQKQDQKSVHDLLSPAKPSPQALVQSLAVFGMVDIIWIIFFSNFPGEDKTVFQALYMSLITLTTVGFGAFTPLTEEGMIFAAFFMIIGSATIVNVIGQFCEFVAMMNEYQRFSPTVKAKAVDKLRSTLSRSDKVSESEFFRFIVLHENLMTQCEADHIIQAFNALNPKDGMADFSAVEAAMEVGRPREQLPISLR